MADKTDLGSVAIRRLGSNPSGATIKNPRVSESEYETDLKSVARKRLQVQILWRGPHRRLAEFGLLQWT